MRVEEIRRYPIKSMLGESLAGSEVTAQGLAGDRARAVLDVATGKVASAKHPRLWRDLLGLHGTQEHDDASLSAVLGRQVRLIATPPENAELEKADPEEVLAREADLESRPEMRLAREGGPERGLAREGGSTEGPAREADDVTVRVGRLGGAAPGTFFDFAPVHLITTSTLTALGGMEAVRYRPNLVIGGAAEGFPENGWVGREVGVGAEVVLEVIVVSPRCVVPTLAHGDLPKDREALRRPAERNRVPVFDLGELPCAGAYAKVLRPGTIRTGDPVALLT
ncbi:MOSC N-terminal beta barrel domain-containing protein [Nonomuraea sp. NPDC050310]|uniref:MOSC domain-containing protein n=1 Tax=Nonomuraea sp. NPDC050310 TaxID=3154935 RepID=UPI003404956A